MFSPITSLCKAASEKEAFSGDFTEKFLLFTNGDVNEFRGLVDDIQHKIILDKSLKFAPKLGDRIFIPAKKGFHGVVEAKLLQTENENGKTVITYKTNAQG